MSQPMDRKLALEAVRVTEAAAIASARQIGRGDERAADQAAVDAMRAALNELPIDGTVVIGEGERDEAPMLYIGEKVGAGGTARRHRARSARRHDADRQGAWPTRWRDGHRRKGLAAQRARHLHGQDRRSAGLSRRRHRSRRRSGDNILALAKAKGVDPSEITVCVLDRPRHAEIIASRAQGRRRGAPDHRRRHRRRDRDRPIPTTGVDIYIGQGGAPEGVLAARRCAASAARCRRGSCSRRTTSARAPSASASPISIANIR
jgi:fructose-1,6-bisphosphatase II / sedoheptulose-1,7-bisphosphatase